jgi:hypothetical protein
MRPPAIPSSFVSTSRTNCGRSRIGQAPSSWYQYSRQLSAPQTIAEEPDRPACRGMFVSYVSLNPDALHSSPLSWHSCQKRLQVACNGSLCGLYGNYCNLIVRSRASACGRCACPAEPSCSPFASACKQTDNRKASARAHALTELLQCAHH